jgi:hypothetical protein
MDEDPSSYLPALQSLHGDDGLDRLTAGSGRGLTKFHEDVRDGGENIRDRPSYLMNT